MSYSDWDKSEDTGDLVNQLTNKLAERIKDMGLTQGEAAARVGCDRPNLNRFLRKKGGVGWGRLLQMLTALGLDVDIKIRGSSRQKGRISIKASGA